MKIQKGIIKIVVADEGKLLTQAGEVPAEERIFSSRIYDSNLENWTEWTQEQVDKFIEERDIVQRNEEQYLNNLDEEENNTNDVSTTDVE
jgi:hypothetical protein